jgi:formylglycine-generating enzyme required for sulfatase activity
MLAAYLVLAMSAEPYIEKLPGTAVEFKMVPIPAGKVKIGDKVVGVKPFHMAATETTWDMFDAFLLSGEPSKPYEQKQFAPDAIARPSRSYILPDLGWGHQGYPVINVSETTVEMFCRWLRSVTKKNYRLPTEAEWEFAAREGQEGDWSISKEELDKREWYVATGKGTTNPVGKRAPNKFGLFDILGNVGEWATDLSGKPVLCGGDFGCDSSILKPSARQYYSPDWQATDPQLPKSRWWLSDGPFVGFRVVMSTP